MTILLAGFSAFPGAPENPAEALVRSFEGVRTAAGEAIATLVLPVEWEGTWPKLAAAIEARRPRAVLLVGLNARAGEVRIELTARNVRELGREDAAGEFPSGPFVTEGTETLEARLPLAETMAGLRREGVGFALSRDAGRYLCNDTFYRLCRNADRLGIGAHGLMHIPLTDEAVPAWAATGALPDLCRTVPAGTLRRAVLAVCEAVSAPGA